MLAMRKRWWVALLAPISDAVASSVWGRGRRRGRRRRQIKPNGAGDRRSRLVPRITNEPAVSGAGSQRVGAPARNRAYDPAAAATRREPLGRNRPGPCHPARARPIGSHSISMPNRSCRYDDGSFVAAGAVLDDRLLDPSGRRAYGICRPNSARPNSCPSSTRQRVRRSRGFRALADRDKGPKEIAARFSLFTVRESA